MAAVAELSSPDIRSQITDDEFGGFRITIPGPSDARRVYGCMLAIWALVLSIAVHHLIADTRAGRSFSPVLAFLGVWAVVGFLPAYALAYCLTGREVVRIDGKALVLRSEILGRGRSRMFDLAGVKNLRPVRRIDDSFEYRGNAIAFDHGGKTYLFGGGLSDHEILRLIKTIRQRFPIRDDMDDAEPLPVIT
jgi:hypothetical protein